MCKHLRRRHLTPAPLTLRLQFSQPGLYLIRQRRIEQVLHDHMPPLNESNQEPVSERSFLRSPIEYSIGAVQKIGFRTIRPYAMNAMRRPSKPLKMRVVISPYLAGTQTNTHHSIVRIAA